MTSVVLPGADTRTRMRRLQVEKFCAVAVVPLVFARLDLPVSYLTLSSVVVLALAPVWLGVLGRFENARLLVALGALAVVCGVWMAAYASSTSGVNRSAAIDQLVTMATFLGAFGVVLWARTHLKLYQIAVLAGLGQLATLSTSSTQFASNPWRFGFSIPVTIVVLAVAWWIGSRWVQMVCLVALAGISMVTDSRSNFGMLVLAAILMFVRPSRPRERPTRAERSWVPTVLVIAAAAWIVFQVAQTLILDGYLGEKTQARSVAQVEASGSLILGGRPELAATAALLREHPTGFGLGVSPTPDDIIAAKTGMASINYDPNNGYVERYMLGDRFELHSVFGDLWANYGIAGLVFAVAVVAVIIRGVALHLRAAVGASALIAYLAIRSMWGIAFSPFQSAALLIALCLGLIVFERRPRRRTEPAGVDVPGTTGTS